MNNLRHVFYIRHLALQRCGRHAEPQWFGQHKLIPWLCPGFSQVMLRVDKSNHGKTEFRLFVLDGVATCNYNPRPVGNITRAFHYAGRDLIAEGPGGSAAIFNARKGLPPMA